MSTKNNDLAEYLARQLLECHSDPNGECKRIQFMLGDWPKEKPGGGLCEAALVSFFRQQIDQYAASK